VRWGLGAALNPVSPTLPLGTLATNLCGDLMTGAAVEVFGRHADAPPKAHLAVMTGFLGGFTTFSTFSAEVVNLVGRKLSAWSLLTVGAHVLGSLLLTIIGLWLARLLVGGAT
jgi:CrcB protein